jgi:hypothetical protein
MPQLARLIWSLVGKGACEDTKESPLETILMILTPGWKRIFGKKT